MAPDRVIADAYSDGDKLILFVVHMCLVGVLLIAFIVACLVHRHRTRRFDLELGEVT